MALIGKRLAAACCALVASVQICAADNTLQTNRPLSPLQMRPAVFDWQGSYGGLLFAVKSFSAGMPGLGGPPRRVKGRGRLAGIIAGHNFRQGNWVYGMEADIGYGQIRVLNSRRRLESDLMGTLRARLGHDFDGNLLFGTAGVSFAGLNQTSALMTSGDTSTHIGWIVGGGIEHAFARTLTGRLEYLYGRNLQEKDTGIRDLHMIRAGAIYHLPK